jgi:type II secretory pathway component PulM
MRSPSPRESRLLVAIGAAAFLLVNYLGFQQLSERRHSALAQQRTYKLDLTRLRELQAAKPAVDVNTEWIESRLPAYKDVDQFETYLFNVVLDRAAAAGNLELTKKDPRPTQQDETVHRSILEIECTAPMKTLVRFLHSLQDREAFRFVSFLELTPTKDEEQIRCQARIEQWWRPDSADLYGGPASGVPVIPSLPTLSTPPPSEGAPVEQADTEAVKTAASRPPPADPPPAAAETSN